MDHCLSASLLSDSKNRESSELFVNETNLNTQRPQTPHPAYPNTPRRDLGARQGPLAQDARDLGGGALVHMAVHSGEYLSVARQFSGWSPASSRVGQVSPVHWKDEALKPSGADVRYQ